MVATPRFWSFACRYTCDYPNGLLDSPSPRGSISSRSSSPPSKSNPLIRRIGRIVYREHARLIIWRRSVRIPRGHHHSGWDGVRDGTGEDCDWRLLGSRARIRIRESFVGHIRSWTMDQSHYYWWHVAILLHGSKHHCTTEKPARQPSLPASQLRTLLQNTRHTTHQTSRFSQRQSIHPPSVPATHTHLAAATIHQSSINQSIDQWSMYGSMGVMVRDLEWRGRHFLLFLWAIVMDLASALRMPSPVWINIAPEKSFQSIRSLSTQ